MQLKEFMFEEKNTGWKLDNAYFENLTLLVGASGVGKTKILEAIEILPSLSGGHTFNGIKWRAIFYDNEFGEIIWEGETEQLTDCFDNRQVPFIFPDEGNEKKGFKFIYESMVINGEEIFIRDNKTGSSYKGSTTVKLQREKSLLNLLQEEDILNIKNKIARIYRKNYALRRPISADSIKKWEKDKNLEDIVTDSDIGITTKLFIAYNQYCDIFNLIKQDFLEIFPFVEDIRFGHPDVLSAVKYNPAPEMRVLQLKEFNSNHWICVWDFSSGMHKAIALLSAMYLSPENSIFLIDEFENSFGVNCIDLITKKLLSNFPAAQFILASHHPYIINSIPYKNWRLVTRANGSIKVDIVNGMMSNASKHDAFIQLINLDEYSNGVRI